MKYLILLTITFMVLAVSSNFLPAQGVESQITSHGWPQTEPAVSGNWIVWTDVREGPRAVYMIDLTSGSMKRIMLLGYQPAIWEHRVVFVTHLDVYMYNILADEITQITNTSHPAYKGEPAIWGNRIVWIDTRIGSPDVFLYELSTGSITNITADYYVWQYSPSIYGDRIVWREVQGGRGKIFLYNLSTHTKTRITSTNGDEFNPEIWGDRIVWEDDRHGNFDIYMYDLATETETQITFDSAAQGHPAIWENRIVWSDARHGNYDIYLYDLSTGIETRITTDTSAQIEPAIWDDRIVWQDDRNSNWDIYMFTLQTSPEDQINALIAKVNDLVESSWISNGQGNALIVKLDAALKSLEKGNIKSACNQLGSFINQVEAFMRSEILNPEQGQALIGAAVAVKNKLCG